MIHELAQAIRDLAMSGRLSEESEENISVILDNGPTLADWRDAQEDWPPDEDDEPEPETKPEPEPEPEPELVKPEPAKSTAKSTKSTTTGGSKS